MSVGGNHKLTPAMLDRLVGEQRPFDLLQPIIDLRAFHFVTPGAMTQLAALCFALANHRRKPQIFFNNSSVHTYLERAGFLPLVADHVTHNAYIPSLHRAAIMERRGSRSSLIEIERLDTGDTLNGLIQRMFSVLTADLGFPTRNAWRVGQIISEAGQNPFEHNAMVDAFLVMQLYRGAAGQFLEIGVSDCGVGIAATLARNPDNPVFATDAEAIKHATLPHTSGAIDAWTRGNGLHDLLTVTRSLGGTVRIRSGTAALSLSRWSPVWTSEALCHLPGVHITISVAEAALHETP